MFIDDILNQTIYGEYLISEDSKIKDCLATLFKDAFDKYCKENDLDENSVTYRDLRFKSISYKFLIESICEDIDKKKKMTIKDIERELGYKIEIIS